MCARACVGLFSPIAGDASVFRARRRFYVLALFRNSFVEARVLRVPSTLAFFSAHRSDGRSARFAGASTSAPCFLRPSRLKGRTRRASSKIFVERTEKNLHVLLLYSILSRSPPSFEIANRTTRKSLFGATSTPSPTSISISKRELKIREIRSYVIFALSRNSLPG